MQAVGRKAEELVLEKLKQNGVKKHGKKYKVWLNDGKNLEELRKCDIEDEFGIRWEVKCDRMWAKTGNVFLEHIALGHSSSDYVVYVLDGDKNYIVPLTALREIMEDSTYRKVQGGNSPDNFGTLYPVEELRKLGVEL